MVDAAACWPTAETLPDGTSHRLCQPTVVTLANGELCPLAGYTPAELHRLQWEEEQAFAAAIHAQPPGSSERAEVTARAYDTICTILAACWGQAAGELSMGMDARYVRLVLELLGRQQRRGLPQPALFEVGYGSGAMLQRVQAAGYPAAGIEISGAMREQALVRLGAEQADTLLVGDVRDVSLDRLETRPTIIYWNDVFEHVPVDEIDELVAHLCHLLMPGGWLVTITPNWLLRPSDVTAGFCPPRTAARGLHLKEYRLAEVTHILRCAGFRRIATPLFATKHRLAMWGAGGRAIKTLLEPAIDRLPLRLAHLLCRGWALSCTVATK